MRQPDSTFNPEVMTMKTVLGGVCAAKGFTANGVHCGIRKNRTKRDLALIASEVPASAASVYTTNLVKGAPLTVTCEMALAVTGVIETVHAQNPLPMKKT